MAWGGLAGETESALYSDVGRGKSARHFDTDEHPRATSREDLAGLRAAFKEDGSVTAGNASGINDGAAAVVLASESAAAEQGLKPMARVLSYGFAAVPPEIMGVGPVPASKVALDRAGITADDLDVIESKNRRISGLRGMKLVTYVILIVPCTKFYQI